MCILPIYSVKKVLKEIFEKKDEIEFKKMNNTFKNMFQQFFCHLQF